MVVFKLGNQFIIVVVRRRCIREAIPSLVATALLTIVLVGTLERLGCLVRDGDEA
jgi:hypothetical protein